MCGCCCQKVREEIIGHTRYITYVSKASIRYWWWWHHVGYYNSHGPLQHIWDLSNLRWEYEIIRMVLTSLVRDSFVKSTAFLGINSCLTRNVEATSTSGTKTKRNFMRKYRAVDRQPWQISVPGSLDRLLPGRQFEKSQVKTNQFGQSHTAWKTRLNHSLLNL